MATDFFNPKLLQQLYKTRYERRDIYSRIICILWGVTVLSIGLYLGLHQNPQGMILLGIMTIICFSGLAYYSRKNRIRKIKCVQKPVWAKCYGKMRWNSANFVMFRYENDGKKCSSRDAVSLHHYDHIQPGDRLHILIDPKHPKRAMIAPF